MSSSLDIASLKSSSTGSTSHLALACNMTEHLSLRANHYSTKKNGQKTEKKPQKRSHGKDMASPVHFYSVTAFLEGCFFCIDFHFQVTQSGLATKMEE